MLPKLWCFIVGHKRIWKHYDPEKNRGLIGLIPGYNGCYTTVWYDNCPRCGVKL